MKTSIPMVPHELRPGALDAARARGETLLRLTLPLSIPEAISIARMSLPPADPDHGRGWVLYVPAGLTIGLRPAVEIQVGAERVRRGDLIALNYAWVVEGPTGARRVLLRCAGSATVDERRDVVWPVDLYEDQIASVQTLQGAPMRVPGWLLVDQSRFDVKA